MIFQHKSSLVIFLLFLTVLYLLFSLQIQSPKIEENQIIAGDAMKALDFWTAQRAYPNRVIPDRDFYKAYQYSETRLKKRTRGCTPNDAWHSIGPENQGGRTIALAVDPQNPDVIYAGSASGGLWRLTMHGSGYSWEYIDTGFPVLGVNAIAINPDNSDEIYIGTGEVYGYQNSDGGIYVRTTRGSYSIGLLKSTDRGVTWTKIIDWSYQQKRSVLSLAINPLNPKVVFAGTTEGTFRSTDAGATWQKVQTTVMTVDVDINPVDTNFVFISCGNLGSAGTGIYRSPEGGMKGTWKRLTTGLPQTWGGKALLTIYPASPDIIYASIGEGYSNVAGTWLCKSIDNGETWNIINSFNYARYQGWFAHYVRVNPVDDTKIICAGVNFFLSNNSGQTLVQRNGMHVDHHTFANHPTDPDIIYFGNDGGVYRTTDGGYSFENLNEGYITTQFYNGFSSSPLDSNFALGGLQDNSTVRYYGNKNWYTGLIGGDGAFTAINPVSDNIVYGSWQYLHILRSRQNGLSGSWVSISTSLKGNDVAFIAPFVLAPSAPYVIYAAKDIVYRSDNNGTNWRALNSGNPLNGNAVLSMAAAPTNPDVLYAATVPNSRHRAEVFVTRDGGYTWMNITQNLPDRYYVDLQVAPHNDRVAYITVSGFGSSHLFMAENGGQSWKDIGAGLPDVPASSVAIVPEAPHPIYLGNDLGVYVSTDFGEGWQEFSEGLRPAVLVMDLSISESNRSIRAVTHGNGVYQRRLLTLDSAPPDSPAGLNDRFILLQNFPNPFNPETEILFDLKLPSFVTIKIYNSLGQKIRTLAANGYPAGNYSVRWDGNDNSGKPAVSGTYFYSMKAGTFTAVKKMLLMR